MSGRGRKGKGNVKEDSEVSVRRDLAQVTVLTFSHSQQIKEVRSWLVQLPLNQEQRLPGSSHLSGIAISAHYLHFLLHSL